MIFKVKLSHYEEWNDKIVTSHMFVCAESTVEAVREVSDYYGEKCLEDITVSPFAPDNFLIIEGEDDELFHDFANRASENICW